jgi:hypothetical protein
MHLPRAGLSVHFVALVSGAVLCAATLPAVTLATVGVLVERVEGFKFLASLAGSHSFAFIHFSLLLS